MVKNFSFATSARQKSRKWYLSVTLRQSSNCFFKSSCSSTPKISFFGHILLLKLPVWSYPSLVWMRILQTQNSLICLVRRNPDGDETVEDVIFSALAWQSNWFFLTPMRSISSVKPSISSFFNLNELLQGGFIEFFLVLESWYSKASKTGWCFWHMATFKLMPLQHCVLQESCMEHFYSFLLHSGTSEKETTFLSVGIPMEWKN